MRERPFVRTFPKVYKMHPYLLLIHLSFVLRSLYNKIRIDFSDVRPSRHILEFVHHFPVFLTKVTNKKWQKLLLNSLIPELYVLLNQIE
uniref:Uncharacterized protein n=1 Tax=Lepeophtheirus salmonis TaxID=72036 RepID=A0A0K2TC53_LEPSM